MAGGLSLKLTFCFRAKTHEPLHFDAVLYNERSWRYLQVLFESFSLTEILNMAVFRNCEVMLTNTELLRVEFCNFVLCHVFVLLLFYQRCFEYYRYRHGGRKILEVMYAKKIIFSIYNMG
jgi:hypothetical protein